MDGKIQYFHVLKFNPKSLNLFPRIVKLHEATFTVPLALYAPQSNKKNKKEMKK